MSKIIAINSGSSSLKFQLFQMPEEKILTSGVAERIGLEEGIFSIVVNGEKVTLNQPIKDHFEAVNLLLDSLVKYEIVSQLDEINAAGHRVVQGGSYYNKSVIVNDEVLARVEELAELAPLHNPAHLVCYHAFKKALPNIEHVFVFDTAFHQTMTEESFIYPVPYEWYTNYKIRKYGAHGTSHQFVSQETAKLLGKDLKDTNIITCHLGNGASITAIKGGKCINTSMGLSPLGGIMMGTRCGDIDPTIVFYMMKKLNLTPDEIDNILNKKSGMLGISGISSDARDIQKAIEENNARALLTESIYINRIINIIGGYYMQLGHVDAISFTAGLGEHAVEIREKTLKLLQEGLSLVVDYDLNRKAHSLTELSKVGSKVRVFVLPTNEELMIVKDTCQLLGL